MQGATWYYLVGGLQQGPIDTAGLVALIKAGRLPPGTLVWRDGMASWQAWGMLPELVSSLRPAGMPPPPVLPPPPAGWQGPGPVAPWPGYPTGLGGVTYPKAPLGARFAAMLIDIVLIPLPVAITFVVLMGMTEGAGEENPIAHGVLAIVTLVLFIATLVYLFVKDGLRGGQSLGKRAAKLMVVHLPTNLPCNKGRSALRYLVWVGFNFIPFGWMVEPLVGAVDADGRRLGDRAASTQVIAVQDYRSASDLGSIFS